MKKLSDTQYQTMIAGIRGEKVDRLVFEAAARRIRVGSGMHPEGLQIDRDIPTTRKEWRSDTQWSIDLVDRHQAASEAAYMTYWKIMGTAQK